MILLNALADPARAAPNLSAALTTARARASQACLPAEEPQPMPSREIRLSRLRIVRPMET
jgi:hypothetical protein